MPSDDRGQRIAPGPNSPSTWLIPVDHQAALSGWMGGQGLLDANGRPAVFFHGTPSQEDIDELTPGGRTESRRTGDAYGVGVYLTTCPHEASNYARGSGQVMPLFVRGHILDIDGPLSAEASASLTKFAAQHLLPSDKADFDLVTVQQTFSSTVDAIQFFRDQVRNWQVFGDGRACAKPKTGVADGAYLVSYVDFDAPITIRCGLDAYKLFKRIGWDNLRAAGFDGLRMKRDDGSHWVVMHNTIGTIKSALGNRGYYSPRPSLSDQDLPPASRQTAQRDLTAPAVLSTTYRSSSALVP